MRAKRQDRPITKPFPSRAFEAVSEHPVPRRTTSARGRPFAQTQLALAMVTAPRVNAPAWFALAVAAPLALLAIAVAAGKSGPAQAAAFWAAMLLMPAIVLALRSLEHRRFDPTPQEARDHDLTRAFCLTTGQACGLLLVVAAGARFSGESVAVGLAMAGAPLALAVTCNLWRRVVRPLDERLAASDVAATAGRNWTAEWLQAEALRAPPVAEPSRVTPLRFPESPAARPTGRVTLQVRPIAPDEGWMTAPDLAAPELAVERRATNWAA